MCFILCMICCLSIHIPYGTEMKKYYFSKKLTREEAAAFKEPDNSYEDEKTELEYQLLNWELKKKTGEEKRFP